jgi:predicted transposase YdaD
MENTAKPPAFMEEDWLKSAFEEFDIRAMTPDKYRDYMMYKMRIAEGERLREELIRESEKRGEERGEKRGEKRAEKRGEIKSAIKFTDWDDAKIAADLKVEIELVRQIRKELGK